MRLGQIYDIAPEPMNEALTRFVDAGVLRIGVEYRAIDNASLHRAFADDPKAIASLDRILGDQAVGDRGISLHVCGAADGHEYLRFDCFESGPHYHYNHRVAEGEAPVNHVVPFDSSACGDMLDWAIERVRTHLPAMLTEAGGSALAAALEPVALTRAAVEIAQLARL